MYHISHSSRMALAIYFIRTLYPHNFLQMYSRMILDDCPKLTLVRFTASFVRLFLYEVTIGLRLCAGAGGCGTRPQLCVNYILHILLPQSRTTQPFTKLESPSRTFHTQ
jgi:hypothetical protein